MNAVTDWLTYAGGAARTLARTAAASTADVANGLITGASAAAGAMTGRESSPATLRVRVVVLSDESGPLCRPEEVEPAIAAADRVLRDHAGIRVRLVETVVDTTTAPLAALDPPANRGLLWHDIAGRTQWYRERLPGGDFGLAGTCITVIVVRSIGGRSTGCSLGGSVDWVVCQASLFRAGQANTYDETVLAHELGHALNLPHHKDSGNLMFPMSSPPDGIRGTALTWWQRSVLRSNRRVIPGVAQG